MELELIPHESLSPLETLLSIYSPILECLVSNLPTMAKLRLAQTSRKMRELLYSHPLLFAHLDFRLQVFETAAFDTYPPGTVYNIDKLLQLFPIEGRIVSLTLDWTAVSGYFLFNKILDRCSYSLEHLSVRGCRKVSIKHHIVPHFVYQSSIAPLQYRYGQQSPPKPVLKSLYVYKARGVRRKPFLIDRKPADGDEPSRYLTTLCSKLGIWLDLGLCPTPKLRCPRRREILRRGKEKFCVPFDRRWRVQESDSQGYSQADNLARLRIEQSQGENLHCWNCDAKILDRCEACVHQMTCTACERPLCHNCAYINTPSPTSTDASADQQQVQGIFGSTMQQNPISIANQSEDGESDTYVPSPLLVPCCSSAQPPHADNLCAPCHAEMNRAACSLCDRKLCIKHELDRCRSCDGGCGRVFCFTPNESPNEPGCGELEGGAAQMRDCLGCDMEVCGACRTRFAENSEAAMAAAISSSPSPAPSDDDGSDSTLSGSGDDRGGGVELRKTTCDCRVCRDNYFCPSCWPTKPIPCESRPRYILQQRKVLGGTVLLLLVGFEEPTDQSKWFTPAALESMYPHDAEGMMKEFETRQRMESLGDDRGKAPATCNDCFDHFEQGLGDIRDGMVMVSDKECILERVLAIKNPAEPMLLPPEVILSPHFSGANLAITGPNGMEISEPKDTVVLCKWLGHNMTEVSWVRRANFAPESREDMLVEQFIQMCKVEAERERERERDMVLGESSSSAIFDHWTYAQSNMLGLGSGLGSGSGSGSGAGPSSDGALL